MPIENAIEDKAPQESHRGSQQIAWKPCGDDFRSFGTSLKEQQLQANSALIGNGLLTDLRFDSLNVPPLAQSESCKVIQGYAERTVDLDAMEPSELSKDAQFGGAVGNWVRYLGKAAWHTIDGMSHPGGTDEAIFGSIVNAKHYCAENSMQSAFTDISQLSQDAKNILWNIPHELQTMTSEQQLKASAELTCGAFFFFGAKSPIAEKVAELMKLEERTELELQMLGIRKRPDAMEDSLAAPFDHSVKVEKTGD